MEDSSPPRFDFVTAEKKESLLDAAIPKSTKTATHFWLSVFSEFCRGSESACDWKCIEEEDLAVLLENFYCSAKKQDKSDYKRASLIAARGAFQRHLNSLERGIDLQGPKFAKSNKLLDAVLKERKRAGQEAPVQHKESVTDEDWILLKEYFSDVSSSLDVKKVSQYVWFYTTLHFCLRGSEAQSQLKASDLVFSTVAGEEAILLRAEFSSKNHQWRLTVSYDFGYFSRCLIPLSCCSYILVAHVWSIIGVFSVFGIPCLFAYESFYYDVFVECFFSLFMCFFIGFTCFCSCFLKSGVL